MKYKIICKGASHIGKHRGINQDNYILDKKILDSPKSMGCIPAHGTATFDYPFVAGVFDGMGGEERGEVASFLAAQRAANIVVSEKPVDDLLRFCRVVNEDICQFTEINGLVAMGTTAAMLLFGPKDIALCNIGDSKIFRIADEKIEQISVDHYAVAAYGNKPPLSQNLGIPSNEIVIEPYVARGRYKNGDIYLLCSDGLTDMVSQDQIKEIVLGAPIEEAVEALVKAALEAGGKDNITVVLCLVEKARENLLERLFRKKVKGA